MLTSITLPPRTGNRDVPVVAPNTHCLIVIGANGAGKSRFADYMRTSLGPRAWVVCGLRAIYGREAIGRKTGPITDLYRQRLESAPMMRPDLDTEFEQMLALLLDMEMMALLNQKYNPDAQETRWETTPLEHLARMWHTLFPDNRMLVEKGTVLFANRSSAETVSASRLSDGEKAIIYYLGSALLAPRDAVVIVENPAMFLHPSMVARVWEMVEEIRGRGCVVYVTHDFDFAVDRQGRGQTMIVWVRRYDADNTQWDYELLPPGTALSDEIYLTLIGSRKPVMFIEGDGVHSIDAKLYPLVFKDYNVKSLGGCDKVIEATRTFNDLNALHNLDSVGIVDRDRRNEQEVEYLRRRRILVPDVAEIENLLMLPGIVRAVAAHYNHDADKAFQRVRRNILQQFAGDIAEQALQHTRHRVKVIVEHTIDRRFADITQLEKHMLALVRQVRPRQIYDEAYREFETMVQEGDYEGVLRVYNKKSMITESNVASYCGVRGDKDGYIAAVISILRHGGRSADAIRRAIRDSFGIADFDSPALPAKKQKSKPSHTDDTDTAQPARRGRADGAKKRKGRQQMD